MSEISVPTRLRLWPWAAGVIAVHALALVFGTIPGHAASPAGTRIAVRMLAPTPRAAASAHRAETAMPAPPAPTRTTAPSFPPEPSAAEADSTPMAADGADSPAAGAVGDTSVIAAYLSGLHQSVAAHRAYPYAARTRNQEGTALVEFRLSADGTLDGPPSLAQSSGYPRLDAAALEAVQTAAPFPPPPNAAKPWEFRVPVEFQLR